MNTEQLLQQLETKLWRGFNKRYAGHSPSLSFHEQLTNNTPIFRAGFFTLPVHNYPEYVSHSRLPKTRIRMIEAIYTDFRLRSISLFEDHFIILEPSSADNDPHFDIQLNPDIQYLSSHPAASLEDKSLRFQLDQPLILWLHNDTSGRQLEKLPKILHSNLEQEYAAHPLSFLQSADWQFLQKIDILWAEVQDLDDDTFYKTEHLAWLQEIYIHFGWYAKLERFYTHITESNQSEYVKALRGRWLSVRDGLPWKKDTELPDFLNQYYCGATDYRDIQNFWNKLHFPAYRIKTIKSISAEPIKYIVFGLIAMQHQFIWAGRYLELLFSALPDSIHPLIKLLFLLKEQNPYFHFGDRQSYAAAVSRKSRQRLLTESTKMNLSHVQQKTKKQTSISIPSGIDFKIDQAVTIRIKSTGTQLKIKPQILQPVDRLPDYTMLQIYYGSDQVELPLVWNRFKIEFNGLRIKFLRKKIRYQISISHIMPDKLLRIAGQRIKATDSRDAKLYIPVKKQNSFVNVMALNEWGSIPSSSQGLFFNGWALDVFGTLHDQLNISTGNSRGSVPIALNTGLDKEEKLKSAQNTNTFSGRFLSKSKVELKYIDSTLSAFLYTPAELLKHRTTVFTDIETGTIRALFYKAFGFYPHISSLPVLDELFSGYAFLITHEYAGNEVRADNSFKIIPLKGCSCQKGFLIHPQSIETVLNSRFQSK